MTLVRVALVMLVVGSGVYAGLALVWPPASPPVPALAAVRPLNTRTPRPSVTATSGPLLRLAPLVEPSATPEPTVTASATLEPSATPEPTVVVVNRVSEVSTASFQAQDKGMRHNILVALDANNGALRRVVIAPGTTFSFNDALGPNANRLPWKSVGRLSDAQQSVPALRLASWLQATSTPEPWQLGPTMPPNAPVEATPQPDAAPPTPPAVVETSPVAPSPTNEPPKRIYVLGGGVCDLASRYVVAGRRLLSSRSFAFKRHTGGIAGVRAQDAVSIWTTDNGRGDNDLLVTNGTQNWLVFEAHVEGSQITVQAWLQDGP